MVVNSVDKMDEVGINSSVDVSIVGSTVEVATSSNDVVSIGRVVVVVVGMVVVRIVVTRGEVMRLCEVIAFEVNP